MYEIDKYGLAMDINTPYTNYACSDTAWRSAIYSMAYNDVRPLKTALSQLLNKNPEEWIRHPVIPDSIEWGTYSRDQLILVIAGCKFFNLSKEIKIIDKKISFSNKIGNKFSSTFWLKAWFWLLTKRFRLLAIPLYLSYILLDAALWSVTKKNAFNRHLCAWTIYSLDDGIIKSLSWMIFNLNYNKPTWVPKVYDNELYLAMQNQLSISWRPHLLGYEYPWQEGNTKPEWMKIKTLEENDPGNAIIRAILNKY